MAHTLKVQELRNELAKRGLYTSGRKSDLVSLCVHSVAYVVVIIKRTKTKPENKQCGKLSSLHNELLFFHALVKSYCSFGSCLSNSCM